MKKILIISGIVACIFFCFSCRKIKTEEQAKAILEERLNSDTATVFSARQDDNDLPFLMANYANTYLSLPEKKLLCSVAGKNIYAAESYGYIFIPTIFATVRQLRTDMDSMKLMMKQMSSIDTLGMIDAYLQDHPELTKNRGREVILKYWHASTFFYTFFIGVFYRLTVG